jgi:hypothetical protein
MAERHFDTYGVFDDAPYKTDNAAISPRENLAHLVNVDALLSRLTKTTSTGTQVSLPPKDAHATLIPFEANWAGKILSKNLKDKLTEVHGTEAETHAFGTLFASPSQSTRLNQFFELLVQDVMASRDRLLSLNPGRRNLIERRLEFIGRKIARQRGEKLTRSLSLPEVLKDSYRDNAQAQHKLGVLAWRGFASEVALYHMLELFFLKSLDAHGWRTFEPGDLGRLNYAAHCFLSQRATGFAFDRHCWNFVRTNLYSWYVPSQTALAKLNERFSEPFEGMKWTDKDLVQWASQLPAELRLSHLNFSEESPTARLLLELLEGQLAMPLVSNFQGQAVCKKVFIPALESGDLALSILEKQLGRVGGSAFEESSQLHRTLWACESESFEVFWVEVVSLLKFLRITRSSAALASGCSANDRIPHAMHSVQLLGLELHNLEQLPLEGPEVSKLHQGSAAQIQQLETFDMAIVTDHIDRVKSSRWMKALSDQLPYWRRLVGAGTNLNWGELHLYLALSKLKEGGVCLYLSHRMLPEGGDGEKLRRSVLSLTQLECFLELEEDAHRPYRYLYVFRRTDNKLDRDRNRPRFGKITAEATRAPSRLRWDHFEEANSSQAEIMERGWDHLFVRGAAPLVRHLNHKFPKLFQVATVQVYNPSNQQTDSATNPSSGLFSGAETTNAIQGTLRLTGENPGSLAFSPFRAEQGKAERVLVFPHNPSDQPWVQCLLNSAPAQFWIRHQLLATSAGQQKNPKLIDLRSCPIVDLSHSPADSVHEALDWLGSWIGSSNNQKTSKPNIAEMKAWACNPESPLVERYAKYVALSKRYSTLERIVSRYQPLFVSGSFEEMRHDAITQFYPAQLLCPLSQCPDVRAQFADRTRSPLTPEHWTVADVHSVVQSHGGKTMAYLVVYTRQGPSVQLMVPAAIREYLCSQIQSLKDHTWGEVLSLLRVPRDIALFRAQTTEITQVVASTAQEMKLCLQVLEDLALDLFEVSADVRQFLPH